MRKAFGDAMISIGALGALLTILAAVDDRVREQVSWRLGGGHAPQQIADAGSQMRDVFAVLFDAARTQSIEHAPLVIFVAAATMLTLFMLRT